MVICHVIMWPGTFRGWPLACRREEVPIMVALQYYSSYVERGSSVYAHAPGWPLAG